MAITVEDIASGLNDLSWDILQYLSRFESVSREELLKTFPVDKSKISKETARLQGGCLIVESFDPLNNKKKLYSITETGLSALQFRK